jgi:thymidylate synthase
MPGDTLHIAHIKATTIPDAWFQCIWEIIDHGFTYEIQHGSYVGDKRLEMDFVTVHITHPQVRPLEPDIPAHYGIPNPVEQGYIEQYLPYLMTDAREPGEDYTYGQRIVAGQVIDDSSDAGSKPVKVINQVEHFIRLLRETPNTNQAILQVGQPSDCLLSDPPCLRHIDMRIRNGRLIFYPYFRSWDLWGGFPANLGGMVYLQEYMAGEIGAEPGPFICSSKGLHLYKYVWELAELRTGKKTE